MCVCILYLINNSIYEKVICQFPLWQCLKSQQHVIIMYGFIKYVASLNKIMPKSVILQIWHNLVGIVYVLSVGGDWDLCK